MLTEYRSRQDSLRLFMFELWNWRIKSWLSSTVLMEGSWQSHYWTWRSRFSLLIPSSSSFSSTAIEWVFPILRRSDVNTDTQLPVLSLDISSDSKLIITGSSDKNVKIWGMDFGDCHRSIYAHDDSVMQVAFEKDSHYFWSVGKDQTVKYWDGDKVSLGRLQIKWYWW